MALHDDVEKWNRMLRQAFALLGLDPDALPGHRPVSVEGENRRLRALLEWVCVYRDCRDREELARRGFVTPPVYPEISPDDAWTAFERWVGGGEPGGRGEAR